MRERELFRKICYNVPSVSGAASRPPVLWLNTLEKTIAQPARSTVKEDKNHRLGVPEEGYRSGLLGNLCLVLIFVLFARTWVFQNSNIPSGSMKNTLLIGDRLIVNSSFSAPPSRTFRRSSSP